MTEMSIARVARAEIADDARIPQGDRQAPDFLLILKRQRWPLILGALLGLLAGGVHHVTSPDRYYAASVVLIDERDNYPGQEFASNFPLLRNETAVLNEMQVLGSLELAKQVTRDLALHEDMGFLNQPVSLARSALTGMTGKVRGLLPVPPQTPTGPAPDEEARIVATAGKLQREIGITRVGRSFSIEISMILNDPGLAAAIANSYAALYLADRQAASRVASQNGAAWLRENIEEVRQSANEAAQQVADFKAENRASDPQGLRELEQRVITLNELHATLLERLEMITIEGSYPISNGRLLSEAVTPRDPALPKAWRLLSAGLVLGLLAGLAIAAWREMRENGVRTGEDVRRLTGLPFLGYLPRFSRRRIQRLRPIVTQQDVRQGLPAISFSRRGSQSAEAGDAAPMRARPRHFSPALYLPSVAPELPYNDTLKGILARLERMSAPGQGCVAAVSSLNTGEGRTTLAANLAQFAALSGLNTLLIDADVPNPALSHALGFDIEAGLGEVLAGKAALEECIETLPVTGLKVLPYLKPRWPTGQVGMMKLASHLQAARKNYDLVVLDSQPLGASTDVTAVLGALDAVVMVADWGRTCRTALEECMANDPDLARKTAGVVLNRAKMGRLGAYGVMLDKVRDRRRAILT